MNNQYIVDASIMVQLLVTEAHTPETKMLFASVDDGNALIVPEFCLLECTNVLWKHVRFHGLAQADSEKQLRILSVLDIRITPIIGLMPRSLEIGLKYQLAVYDSVYIALAEKLNTPLITDDNRQAQAARTEGLILKDVTDFAR
ncbi:MAG: type II toxin-antitoxin system VapC family toxin [Anaerolineae bacterium]